jgi:putative peptidoglycan lipid II flippase
VHMPASSLKQWSERSVNRSIFIASLTIASLTLFVKVVSMVKDFSIARAFGVSSQLDAYLMAWVIPAFAINVLAGAFQSSLIPTYIEVREREGIDAAHALFSTVVSRALLLFCGCTFALTLLGPLLLHVVTLGFDETTRALCLSQFTILLLAVPINGLSMIWGAVLNTDGKFAVAAVAPMAVPLAMLVFLLAAAAHWGSYALVAGLLSGLAVQAGLLAWSLRRRGLSLAPRWRDAHPATRQVMQQYLPMVAGAVLMGSTELIDQAMATLLGAGSVSALHYGTKLTALVIGTGSLALGTSVLPYFSQMTARQDWRALRHTLRTYSRLVLAGSLLVTAVIVLFSAPLVRLLFQRGAFTESDTLLVSQIQAFYVLQVPFYFLSTLKVRLISSLKANRLLLIISAINFCINVALNYIFMQWFSIAGIALSTAVVYAVSYCLLSVVLRARMNELDAT